MLLDSLGRLPAKARLFLAEGNSEAGFIERVLELKGRQDCHVFCFKGIRNFPLVLKNVSDVPGILELSSLGIMLDADSNRKARIASIVANLLKQSVPVTHDDVEHATVVTYGDCRVGVFVSPGNGRLGQIEHMALEEINSSRLWPCIKKYTDCAKEVLETDMDVKSIVQTYISSLKGDLCGVGRAFQANLLDVNHAAYDLPRRLIEQLLL